MAMGKLLAKKTSAAFEPQWPVMLPTAMFVKNPAALEQELMMAMPTAAPMPVR